MTAVLDAKHDIIDCPHCKGKVKLEIEREPATVKLQSGFKAEDIEPIIERAIEKRMPKQKEEPLKPEVKEVPSYLPKHFCKGKGCEGHDNKARKRITKKCSDGECGQVAPENAGKCAFCGNKEFDDLDEDELEFFNKGLEHDHEHED